MRSLPHHCILSSRLSVNESSSHGEHYHPQKNSARCSGHVVKEAHIHQEGDTADLGKYGQAQVNLFTDTDLIILKSDSNPLGQDTQAYNWPCSLLYAFPLPLLTLPTLHRIQQVIHSKESFCLLDLPDALLLLGASFARESLKLRRMTPYR